jgi:hypothetical protein
MPIEFDITLKPNDMYRFNLYQVYTSFSGWFSVLISIALFVWAGVSYGQVTVGRTALYVVFGIVLLVYMPLSLMLRSRQSLAVNEVLRGALHYSIDAEGIAVSQGEAHALLAWDQIYKLVSTKHNVLIYSNRTNAYVIPRDQLGEQYRSLAELAREKLPDYRVKVK